MRHRAKVFSDLCFCPDACTTGTSPEAAPLAASVEQNSVQTVYFNV